MIRAEIEIKEKEVERFTELHAGVPTIKDKDKHKEAMARLYELEELATPKKANMTANNTYAFSKVGHCPNCGETVRGCMKHCDYCGQKLDWGVSDMGKPKEMPVLRWRSIYT